MEALISTLYDFDMRYKKSGVRYLCGIDEVGRGPLAGSVYAAAFIFPNYEIDGVNDSKKLSSKKRERIFKIIVEKRFTYALGISSVDEIDKINILNATHIAMQRALENLPIIPDLVLIDGSYAPNFGLKTENIVKGDSISYSIACASIVAKVLRDDYMNNMDKEFPIYDFKKNKGYGTKYHIESLKKFGPCKIHRRSFLTRILT